MADPDREEGDSPLLDGKGAKENIGIPKNQGPKINALHNSLSSSALKIK